MRCSPLEMGEPEIQPIFHFPFAICHLSLTTIRPLNGQGNRTIVLKELHETFIWLRMIGSSEILKPEVLAGIIEENRELWRVFTSSLKTARANRR